MIIAKIVLFLKCGVDTFENLSLSSFQIGLQDALFWWSHPSSDAKANHVIATSKYASMLPIIQILKSKYFYF